MTCHVLTIRQLAAQADQTWSVAGRLAFLCVLFTSRENVTLTPAAGAFWLWVGDGYHLAAGLGAAHVLLPEAQGPQLQVRPDLCHQVRRLLIQSAVSRIAQKRAHA